MRTFSGKRSALALAIAGVTAMSGLVVLQRPKQQVSSMILPSRAVSITGSVSVTVKTSPKINTKPTFSLHLERQPGLPVRLCRRYVRSDIAAFTAIEMAENGDSGHPNEIAFSSSNKAYDEDWSGDKSGISLYKAPRNLNMARYGRVRVIFSQPARRCWRRTGALCRVPIRVLKPGRTLTTVMRAR
jgi:hypothetical protein